MKLAPLLLLLLSLACMLDAAETLTVAVIPKGTTHEFWKAIHAGAVKAARESTAAGTPVTVAWKGPLKEDDRAQQVDVVQTFVAQNVGAIVLAPLDSTALVAPVEDAVASGVPVVVIDSALKSTAQSSFIATDNHDGGRRAALRLAEVLGERGNVLVLRYAEGSASTEAREAGFLEELARHPDIHVVSSDQHAGPTRDSALTAAQNLLNRHGRDLQGVFTPNESSTAGMIIALKDAGLAGTVKHVGFDASAPLIEALRAGTVQGLVVQDPFQMGYLGVRTAIAAARAEAVTAQVDLPAQVVTPETIDQPAIHALLAPPLAEYLE